MTTAFARPFAFLLCLSTTAAFAQFGPPGLGRAPQLNSPGMAKLFGDNTAFTASVELRTGAGEGAMTIPGKLALSKENSRMEMDLGQMKGAQMPPEAVEMMKSMGMDKTVIISVGDKRLTRMLYPGMKAYLEMATPDSGDTNTAEIKVETTELEKVTLDGHACVKNKQVVTTPDGKKVEAMTWNATDLKKFPVKIETTGRGEPMTMTFKDIKLNAPDAKEFEVPAGYTKYESMQAMMQEVMMKQMGGMGGLPGGVPPAGSGK